MTDKTAQENYEGIRDTAAKQGGFYRDSHTNRSMRHQLFVEKLKAERDRRLKRGEPTPEGY